MQSARLNEQPSVAGFPSNDVGKNFSNYIQNRLITSNIDIE